MSKGRDKRKRAKAKAERLAMRQERQNTATEPHTLTGGRYDAHAPKQQLKRDVEIT